MEILRYPAVRSLTDGIGRTTIWRLEKAGEFPQRRQISPGIVGWAKNEVLDWLAARPVVGADRARTTHHQARLANTKRENR